MLPVVQVGWFMKSGNHKSEWRSPVRNRGHAYGILGADNVVNILIRRKVRRHSVIIAVR